MPAMVRPVEDETDLLLAFLEQQRIGARLATFGLTDAQAGAAPTASVLSVGGLLKHLAAVERSWTNTMLQREQEGGADEYMAGFRLAAGESLASIAAQYEAAARETETVVRKLGLDAVVPVPKDVPWYPDDVDEWTVRWVVLHLVEETARHAGQADILRETIDGASSLSLLAAAEGWPATDWVQPWEPPARP
jgi:uncharacterized damage-inducible protein DinB